MPRSDSRSARLVAGPKARASRLAATRSRDEVETKGSTPRNRTRARGIASPPDLTRWHRDKAPDAKGHGDCMSCGGRCCTYVVVQIPRPRAKVEIDEIRWWLAHRNIEVYIEDRQWHVQFFTPCKHLTPAGRCRIYDHRFDVCRGHETETCEMSSGETEEISFRTTEEFDAYLNRKKKRRKKASTL